MEESGKFIVIVADGIDKYKKNLEDMSKNKRIQVSLQDAASSVEEYDKIVWVHTQYTPKKKGLKLLQNL